MATEETSERRRFFVGLAGAIALPVIVIVDFGLARTRNWSATVEGPWGKLHLLAVAALAAILVAALIPPVRRWVARRWRHLWLADCAFLIALAGAEVWLRQQGFTADFHCRPPGKQYRFEPDYTTLPGLQGASTSTINSFGLRGPELPPREQAYRVLCIGGSTTEGCYLNDDECWTALLMQDLNRTPRGPTWVGAAAVSDCATGHDLRFIANSRMVGKMDCLVLLIGANDLVRLLLGYDQGDIAPPITLRLGMAELAKYIWNVRLGNGLFYDSEGVELFRRRQAVKLPEHSIDFDSAMARYRERIRAIIEVAQSRHVRLVLVSQPVLWDDNLTEVSKRRLWLARTFPEPRPWKMLSPTGCRNMIDRLNMTLREVCRETGTELVDTATTMSGIENYFYDDYHLSEQGSKVFAQLLADAISVQGTVTQSAPVESRAPTTAVAK